MTHLILVERLLEFCNPCSALGYRRSLDLADLKGIPYSRFRNDWYRGSAGESLFWWRWHTGRVRFFLRRLRKGRHVDPIDVDNECEGGRIYPHPIVCDGHHRVIAAVLAEKRLIRCSYGGRVDLLEYLEGKRTNPPED